MIVYNRGNMTLPMAGTVSVSIAIPTEFKKYVISCVRYMTGDQRIGYNHFWLECHGSVFFLARFAIPSFPGFCGYSEFRYFAVLRPDATNGGIHRIESDASRLNRTIEYGHAPRIEFPGLGIISSCQRVCIFPTGGIFFCLYDRKS